jgi:hypothetical protein
MKCKRLGRNSKKRAAKKVAVAAPPPTTCGNCGQSIDISLEDHLANECPRGNF